MKIKTVLVGLLALSGLFASAAMAASATAEVEEHECCSDSVTAYPFATVTIDWYLSGEGWYSYTEVSYYNYTNSTSLYWPKSGAGYTSGTFNHPTLYTEKIKLTAETTGYDFDSAGITASW